MNLLTTKLLSRIHARKMRAELLTTLALIGAACIIISGWLYDLHFTGLTVAFGILAGCCVFGMMLAYLSAEE